MMQDAPNGSSDILYAEWEHEVDEQLKDVAKNDFRQTLKSVHEVYIMEEKPHEFKAKSFFKSHKIYVMAAGIALLIGVAGFFRLYVSSNQSDSEAIFKDYYQPYVSDFTSRSDESVVSNLYFAFQAYESKEYYKAVELFTKVIDTDGSVLMAHFYRGVSCIEIGNYKIAISSFNKILENESNNYYSQAQWYCGLTWLKLNNIPEAKKHFNWLLTNDRFYKNNALEILRKLK